MYDEPEGYDERFQLVEARGYAAEGGRGQLTSRTADTALREYAYWIGVAKAHADNPGLGYASESYRCAAQMAYRALGRYDILSRS